jgi:multiple sugar transport system substrate-binding protein
MTGKKTALLLAGGMLAGMLAGCGKGPETAAETAPQAKQETQEKVQVDNTPAELVFYSTSADSEESFNQRFGDAIRKKFPNYSIKYIQKGSGTTLPEMMTAGTPFDIYFDSIGNFVDGLNTNLQMDMTDLIKKHKIDLNRFEPSLIEAIRQISGGKIYGLPVFTNNMITYYNKDIFDRFGVPYPKDGMTWDDALELSRKLDRSDGGKTYYGLSVSTSHIMRLNSFSAPFVDPNTGKAAIGQEAWKKLFQTVFLGPAQDQGYKAKVEALKGKLPYKNEFVKDRELGMLVYLSNYFTTNEKDLASMNWDMVSMPTFKERPGVGSQSYPTFFTVTSMSKNKDAAMEVLKYLVSDEYQTDAAKKGVIPVLKDDGIRKVLGQDTPFKDKHFQAIFYLQFAPIAPKTIYDVAVEKAYSGQIGDLSRGTVDLNTAIRTAEEMANQAIEAEKNK